MKMNPRTTLAIALFIPLAAVLLATFACLPVPIGDPEKSKVDEALAGIYQLQPADPADKSAGMAILKPWDTRTYVLEYLATETRDPAAPAKEERHIQHYKCWLTPIAGRTFLTCQPMDDLQFVLGNPDGEKPIWVVMRLDKVLSGLEIRLVNQDSDFLKGLTKQEEFEAAIKTHAADDALYGKPATFKKLGKDDKALIEDTLRQFNLGTK